MQVYIGNELVGDLRVSPRENKGDYVLIQKLEDPPIGFNPFEDVMPAPIQFRLKVKQRGVRIEKHREALYGEGIMGEMLKRYHVPEDAQAYEDPASMMTSYRWSAIDLDPELLEEIFDLDIFEPSDNGPPDLERRRAEMASFPFTL